MKKYISHLGIRYVPKNKAEAAAQEVAKVMSKRVINENQVEEFKDEFQARITEVNREHPRCRDLHLDIYDFNKDGELSFDISGVTRVNLYMGFEP